LLLACSEIWQYAAVSITNYETGFLEIVKMRFGKLALTLLIIGTLTVGAIIILRPGLGNPLATLGWLFGMFSFPTAVIVGIVGIIRDKNKLLAVITTIVAGGLILLYLCSDSRLI
jgi:hypothetical membrane protein